MRVVAGKANLGAGPLFRRIYCDVDQKPPPQDCLILSRLIRISLPLMCSIRVVVGVVVHVQYSTLPPAKFSFTDEESKPPTSNEKILPPMQNMTTVRQTNQTF